jgi:hypothetical protein
MNNMVEEKPHPYSLKTKAICIGLAVIACFLGVITWILIAALFPQAPAISSMADTQSAHILATSLEKQVKQWQDSLFLETYAVTYEIDDEGEVRLVLTGQAHFRFVGWRDDWLGKLISHWNSNHLIARVDVDVDHEEVTEFSHSHGEPFGYDAPLSVSNWPVAEEELFQICDNYGGKRFRSARQVNRAHIRATSTRPGRFWIIDYSTSSEYFKCSVNLDSGDISVKNEDSDWRKVGNLQDLD